MADKKKQHYVPRFYLKLFSDTQKKAINLFNISNENHVKRANLKNQCYESYFYGKDLTIENAFSDIEAFTSKLINKILDDNDGPKRFSQDHSSLLTFILLQHARTKYAEQASNEQYDKIIKQIFSKDPKFKDIDFDNIEISLTDGVLNPIRAIAQLIPLVMDLHPKLLINKTNINFITSDNPVFFYNIACEKATNTSNTGLASKGLLIFFPLDPKRYIVFYDSKIYKIGEKNKSHIDLISIKDVEQINDIQWINALENVYHDDSLPPSEILRCNKKNKSKRRESKVIVKEYPESTTPDGKTSSLIHSYKPDIKANLKLSFIKQLRILSFQEMYNGSESVRDLTLIEIHDDFIKMLEKGKFKVSEFSKYLKMKANK